MNKTHIINKVIEYYKFTSNAEFARFLGVKPQVLSNWKARNTFDIELLSSKCLDINPDWLLHGKGPMKRADNKIKKEENNEIVNKVNLIPVFDLTNSIELCPAKQNCILDYVSIPQVKNLSGGVFVVNDNMYPVLHVGDIALYKEVPVVYDEITFGEMYLLSIYIDNESTYKTIRYLQKSDLGNHYIKMVNEDKQYLDKDIELSKIASLGLIQANIHIK
jgi:hypothetical protein